MPATKHEQILAKFQKYTQIENADTDIVRLMPAGCLGKG